MLPPPPVPAGGTLVSSATQAGNPPPPVTAGPHFAASVGGYEGPFGPVTPPGGFGFAPPLPLGSYPQSTSGGHGQGHLPPGATTQGAQMQSAPGGAAHGDEDTTDQVVRVAARPTLIVRRPRSSRLPLAVLAVVGAAGAVVGVWLAIHNDTSTEPAENAPQSAVPGTASPSEPAEATKPGPSATVDPAAEVVNPASADGRTEAAAAAGAAKGPADTAPGSTKVVAPDEPAAQPASGADAPGDAKDPKKRPAKPVPLDVRAKPPKPKVRPEVKRPEPKRPDSKRGQKPEAKEPSWNADSPFLPEATPKR
jgi:hypothetical protein